MQSKTAIHSEADSFQKNNLHPKTIGWRFCLYLLFIALAGQALLLLAPKSNQNALLFISQTFL